jgi:hypothetical protein
MCTVTIVRAGDRLRVACNRDERRDRVSAHPPFITRAGDLRVVMPQDPQGRGTWIAANSAGIVFGLLNVNDGAIPGRLPSRGRGMVIPSLADAATLREVVLRMDSMAVAPFAPFRLLAADSLHVAEFLWRPHAGTADVVRIHRIDHPLLFTSSSLGDAIAEEPRRALFEQMFPSMAHDANVIIARQDVFHAHRWRDRPAMSVHMSRPDACTVSTTIVEVAARTVRIVYHPANCAAGTPAGLVIERQHARRTATYRPRDQHASV